MQKNTNKRKRFGPGRNSLLAAQQNRGARIYNIWKHFSGRNGKDVIVALHVKPDKMPELERETFTA
jgi:hypothetical protein